MISKLPIEIWYSLYVYNLKIKSSMNKETNQKNPLLKQMNNDILEEIEFSEKILTSKARLEEKERNFYNITFVDQLILINSHKKHQAHHSYYIRLDFSIKFQKLTDIKSFGKIQIKGFRLKDDFGQEISFYIDSHKEAKECVKLLSQSISQLGFNNIFKPIRLLGKGSTAAVYQILRVQDGQRFATKTFSKESIKNHPLKLKSLFNEIEILRNLENDSIVRLEGIYETQQTIYVVMEYLSGGNLLQYLVKRKTQLTLDEIKSLLKNILLGLQHLERNNIANRDLKLENIMLRQKDTFEAVIVDFGLAVFADDEDYVYYHCGTPGYIPPQSFTLEKGETIGLNGDIFSLGVILHILMTGRYLFDGNNMASVLMSNKAMNFDLQKSEYSNLDSDGLDLLKKMLQKDSNIRWSASQCLKHSFLMNEQLEKDINLIESRTQIDSENQR